MTPFEYKCKIQQLPSFESVKFETFDVSPREWIKEFGNYMMIYDAYDDPGKVNIKRSYYPKDFKQSVN